MFFVRLFLTLGALLGLASAASAQSGADADVSTVRHVDLARYMGRWFVISRVPNILEWGKVATAEIYSLQPDGTLHDTYVFRKHSLASMEQRWSGSARVTDPVTNAAWKVRLFWPFWPFASSYRVLELDPNYGWAVVATDSGSLFWVLARSPTLDRDTYREILERLRRRRLNLSNLELVPQPAVDDSHPE